MIRDAKYCRIVFDGETIAEGMNVSAEEQSDIQVIHSMGSESPIHVRIYMFATGLGWMLISVPYGGRRVHAVSF
jgi:hypothetical protein